MVPFGFSVGDLIAGINVLIDAVHSLSDTNGAQADYQELGRQLKNLRNGFECIEGLKLDATQSAQASAVNTALNDCRLCVDDFVKRNGKFRCLEEISDNQWSLAALKRQGRKVQWALWKKADVAKFRAAIQQHSDAIQMLLASIHIKQIDSQGKLQATAEQHNVEQRDLAWKKLYDGLSSLSLQQQRMETRLGDGQLSLEQALTNQHAGIREEGQVHQRDQEKALEAQSTTTRQVLREVESMNSHVGTLVGFEQSLLGDAAVLKEHLFTIIANQQQLMAQLQNIALAARVNQEVPPQVQLSKPVVLLDARGRYAPFQLEFIDSAEAFIAVLKVRFKDVGLRKIELGEFALEDSRLKRGLKLTKPWASIVRPGQHISMSMIFRLKEQPTTRCPGCGAENSGSNFEDVECGNTTCGITYRRIVEENVISSEQSIDTGKATSWRVHSSIVEPQLKELNPPENSATDEMQHYTRLRILTQAENTYLQNAVDSSSRQEIDKRRKHYSSESQDQSFKNDKPFICFHPGCDFRSKREFDLRRHVENHFPSAPVDFSCPSEQCVRGGRYSFKRKDHMVEHIARYHEGYINGKKVIL